MKRALFLVAAALLAAPPAHATVEQAKAQCEAFATANKISLDPCTCIANAIGHNETLVKEHATLKTLDDYNKKGSKALHAAVDPCLPPPPAPPK